MNWDLIQILKHLDTRPSVIKIYQPKSQLLNIVEILTLAS